MRKIMKRGFCLFLVAVLLAGLVPCAFADEAMPAGEVEASEAATEAAEEATAPPETAVPSESTEPPEATEATESETEVTEPETEVTEPERWLKEKLYQSRYDECMQARREAWLFLRPGHKKSY